MFKTTKKAMKNNYNKIVSIGYCEAASLLRYQKATAYSVGVYGWSCDYYIVDGVLISNGYRPLADKNTTVDRALLKEYDNKAREIINSWITAEDLVTTHEEVKKQVNELLSEFVEMCAK